MKNILITGGSGFIGSRIADVLKKKHNVICTYYNSPIKIKNIKKIKLSITKKIIIKEKIDIVVHCASKTPANCSKDSVVLNQNLKNNKKKAVILEVMENNSIYDYRIFIDGEGKIRKVKESSLFSL